VIYTRYGKKQEFPETTSSRISGRFFLVDNENSLGIIVRVGPVVNLPMGIFPFTSLRNVVEDLKPPRLEDG